MAFLQGFKAKSEKLRLRSVGIAGKLPGYLDGSAAGDEIQNGRRYKLVGKD